MESTNKIPIRARIYHVVEGQRALKAYADVAIGDYLCINSYSIAYSYKHKNRDEDGNDDVIVFTPTAKRENGEYKRIVEYPNWDENRLKDIIAKLCKQAYKKYEDDGTLRVYTKPIYVGIDELVDFNKSVDQNPHKSVDDNERDWASEVPY